MSVLYCFWLRPKLWFTATKTLICGRGHGTHGKVWELGLGLGWGTDAISTAEKNCHVWTSDGWTKLGQEFGFHLCGAVDFKTSAPLKNAI